MLDSRPGEAIGPLRRAANLGAPGERVWPNLARAFLQRGRLVACYSAVLEAKAAGSPVEELSGLLEQVGEALGPTLETLRQTLEKSPA